MVGFLAAVRAVAGGVCHRIFHQPVSRTPPLDDYLRATYFNARMSYATRAKIRERQSRRRDGNDELQWYDSADRHVPWPNRKRHDKEKEKKNNRRSFKLRSEKYLKPFSLDIFLSNRFVHASIMHRAVHKVVAVANSNAKEFRGTLPAYGDIRACWVIGKVLADRAKEADVYTVVYEPRRGEKLDNKIMTIVNTLVENGIALELDKT